MRNYTELTKFGILVCIVAILLVMINWFTGFINSNMTAGASAVCLSSFIIALYAIINTSNRKQS